VDFGGGESVSQNHRVEKGFVCHVDGTLNAATCEGDKIQEEYCDKTLLTWKVREPINDQFYEIQFNVIVTEC
jgi:hypothetical protein